MRKLDIKSLQKACDTSQFDFESTKDISDLITMLGQERLTSAMEFGTKINQKGYNIFALGPIKTDKQSHISEYLEDQSKEMDVPDDLCYVNNFDDKYKPAAMFLPSGRGKDLKEKMDKLIEDLPPTLTAAFESDEYENRRQALQDKIQDEQDKSLEDIQQKAKNA